MRFNSVFRRCVTVAILATFILTAQFGALAQQNSPFCSDANCTQTRLTLKDICDLIVRDKSTFPAIYIGGYYMRALVAGYEIFGDQRYLDTAVAYSDYLLQKQMPNGFWGTGYGPVYLADTGSALGLFIVLYKHVDREHQTKYFDAVSRYVNSIQKNQLVHRNGAFGTGWKRSSGNTLNEPIYDQYTLSSALTGAEIFTWMYHVTKKDEYRKISYRALRWIFTTMRNDGNIPHVLAMEGYDWSKRGDPKTNLKLFTDHTYGTSAYVGEGILSFDLYCDKPAWKSWIRKAAQPNIEFLLRTQLADGTWSEIGQRSWDRTRSPGIVDYLIWYYEHVDRDPRILRAVQRFNAFVINPQSGRTYGLLNDGAEIGPKDINHSFNTVTALTGRALADILVPGVDARW